MYTHTYSIYTYICTGLWDPSEYKALYIDNIHNIYSDEENNNNTNYKSSSSNMLTDKVNK